MNAINHITSILTACGANPTVTTDKNGNAVIKVNAPEVKPQKDGGRKNEK